MIEYSEIFHQKMPKVEGGPLDKKKRLLLRLPPPFQYVF